MRYSPQQQVHDDETMNFEVVPRRRTSTRRALTVAVVLFAVAAALVYYASQLWLEQQTTRAALDSAKGDLIRLERKSSERGSKIVVLEQQHNEREALLEQANAKALELNTALAAAQTRLDALDQERSQIKEQLAEFRQLTQQFQRMIDSGRLEITFRNGRMVVQLPEQVLFPSGSAELTGEGGNALDEVAKILRTIPDRRFIIAGHTDNVPVATDRFPSNWELSSARAVKVTRELIRGGLRPEQLVAAGYSEYDPVGRNVTESGRQKNRRIEIILEPRLMPLPPLEQAKAPQAPAQP